MTTTPRMKNSDIHGVKLSRPARRSRPLGCKTVLKANVAVHLAKRTALLFDDLDLMPPLSRPRPPDALTGPQWYRLRLVLEFSPGPGRSGR